MINNRVAQSRSVRVSKFVLKINSSMEKMNRIFLLLNPTAKLYYHAAVIMGNIVLNYYLHFKLHNYFLQ